MSYIGSQRSLAFVTSRILSGWSHRESCPMKSKVHKIILGRSLKLSREFREGSFDCISSADTAAHPGIQGVPLRMQGRLQGQLQGCGGIL